MPPVKGLYRLGSGGWPGCLGEGDPTGRPPFPANALPTVAPCSSWLAILLDSSKSKISAVRQPRKHLRVRPNKNKVIANSYLA
jgi:hypothetical protein